VAYTSWLLATTTAGQRDPTVNLLADFDFPRYQVGLRRPVVGLGLVDGRPTLSATSRTQLQDLVNTARDDGPVAAFSVLPTTDLRQLHEQVFVVNGQALRVTCDLCTAPLFAADPYFRRFVRLSYVGPQALDPRGTAVLGEEPDVPDDARLFVKPVPYALQAEQAELLARRLVRDGYVRDGTEYLLLPPVMDAGGPPPSDSYFTAERIGLREALARLPQLQPRPDQAAAVILWRIANDPALRDVLIDGAGLLVGGSPGARTHFRLAVPDVEEQLAAYRRAMLLGDTWPGRPYWAEAVSSRLRADVAELGCRFRTQADAAGPTTFADLPSGALPLSVERLTVATGGARVPALRPFRPAQFPPTGSWQWFDAVAARLPAGELRDRYLAEVSIPGRARSGWAPDHDRTEAAFENECWGWFGPPGGQEAWRAVMVEVVRWVAAGGAVPVERRVAPSADTSPRLIATEGGWRLTHRPDASDLDRARWRLVLPPGSILEPGGAVVLDDPTGGLDRGYWLA
jgi:hypothetical protein